MKLKLFKDVLTKEGEHSTEPTVLGTVLLFLILAGILAGCVIAIFR